MFSNGMPKDKSDLKQLVSSSFKEKLKAFPANLSQLDFAFT